MGKRRRVSDQIETDHHQPLLCSPSTREAMPCSSEMKLLSDEKSTQGDDAALSLPPVMDQMDGSMKLLDRHSNMMHHHQNVGRSLFSKRSRHYYGHHYSRRNTSNRANALSSRGKGLLDERLPFKLSSQLNPESRRHLEHREKPFSRPDRIRSSSPVMDAVSPNAVKKIVCGICQKPLKWKLPFPGSSLSSSNEPSVVAVLVCGHVYHADCLEQRTSLNERCDPPCTVCTATPTG